VSRYKQPYKEENDKLDDQEDELLDLIRAFLTSLTPDDKLLGESPALQAWLRNQGKTETSNFQEDKVSKCRCDCSKRYKQGIDKGVANCLAFIEEYEKRKKGKD
jgi:hypothetical protein